MREATQMSQGLGSQRHHAVGGGIPASVDTSPFKQASKQTNKYITHT